LGEKRFGKEKERGKIAKAGTILYKRDQEPNRFSGLISDYYDIRRK